MGSIINSSRSFLLTRQLIKTPIRVTDILPINISQKRYEQIDALMPKTHFLQL